MAAPRVSSAVWADASYPVCVYIVRMKPSGRTYSQKNAPVVSAAVEAGVIEALTEDEAEALMVARYEAATSAMITSTPSTCQPTETLLKIASSRSAKMFTTV